MTFVRAFVGSSGTDLTSILGAKPQFYSHRDDGAFATVDLPGAPGGGVLSIYGDGLKYGKGHEPTGGDVEGIELGYFGKTGKYVPLGRFEDLPKGVDAGDLIDAIRSKSPLDDLKIFAEIFKGDDEFAGSKQADYFYGYTGSDELNGGKGDDTLDGGAGKDDIDCGVGGRDHVVFSTFDKTFDTISNFDSSDVLDFSSGAFGKLKEVGGHLDATMFRAGKQAVDGNDYLVYDKKSGSLFYDADGGGEKFDKVLIGKFERGTDIDASDIHLI